MTQPVPAAPLLDLLAPPPPDAASAAGTPAGPVVDRAVGLLDFALAEYERIRKLDEALGLLALKYSDRSGALAIRQLYRQWADQSDELLDRVRGYGLRERFAAPFDRLEDAVGRTRAMLSITLESLEQADEEIRTGNVMSLGEVRRELRARSPA